MTTHTSKYAGHTPGPMRAVQQPGQIVGVHTYTHCVMYGDDSIADTLTEPDALLFADAPLILAQRDRLAEALRKLCADYKAGADSGDWGSWKAEKQPEYTQAMAILSELEQTQ